MFIIIAIMYIINVINVNNYIVYINNSFVNSIFRDESFTIGLLNNSYTNIIRYDALDVHPPLYYLLLKLATIPFRLFHVTPNQMIVSYRFFSFITMIIGLIGMTKVVKQLNIKTNIWTYNLFLLAPTLLMYSNQIRMYQLASAIIAWLIYMLLKYQETSKVIWIVGAIIIAEMGAYTHYFTALSCGIILMGVIGIALINKQRTIVKQLSLGLACFVIAYIPWSIVALKQIMTVSKSYWITADESWQTLFNLTGGQHTIDAVTIGMYLCSILVVAQLYIFLKDRGGVISQISGLLLVSILILYGLGIIFTLLNHPILIARYLYPLFFCYLFLIIAVLTNNVNSSKLMLSLIFCGLIFQNVQYMYIHTKGIMPDIAQIKQKPQKGVIKIKRVIPQNEADYFLAMVAKNPQQTFIINAKSIYNVTGRHKLSELSEKVRPNLESFTMYNQRYKN